jgi:acyl-CoA synthetase (AMP-forming)/AMP-acid ligase II
MNIPRTLPELALHLLGEPTDYGRKPALILLTSDQPPRTFTYSEYFSRAAGYAQFFQDKGVLPGEVVILIFRPGEEVLFAFWGALLIGAIPSIFPFQSEKLDTDHYISMIERMIQTSHPALLFTYPGFLPALSGMMKSLTPLPGFRGVFASDSTLSADPMVWLEHAHTTDPDLVAFLQHSSGTTGLQKGITFSHRAVLRYLSGLLETLAITDQDVFVTWLPLYHDMGLLGGFLLPIMRGSTIIQMSPFDWVRNPKLMLWALHTYRGTLAWMPNFAFKFMATRIVEEDLIGLDLSSVRMLISASESVRDEASQAFIMRFAPYGFNRNAVGAAYGMAEHVMAITFTRLGQYTPVDYVDRVQLSAHRLAHPVNADHPLAIPMVSCGLPMREVEIKVCDPDDPTDSPLPERHVGELHMISPFMFKGYYHRPDLTANAFDSHGWYKSGDLGYIADGEVYICGRIKDLIIVGGKNVYPHDLETLAGEVSGVKGGRVVAFGVFNESLSTEDIYIIAEVTTENINERRRIDREIRERLSRQADVTARRIILKDVGWLIKSTSGKMARIANRDKFLAEQGS